MTNEQIKQIEHSLYCYFVGKVKYGVYRFRAVGDFYFEFDTCYGSCLKYCKRNNQKIAVASTNQEIENILKICTDVLGW